MIKYGIKQVYCKGTEVKTESDNTDVIYNLLEQMFRLSNDEIVDLIKDCIPDSAEIRIYNHPGFYIYAYTQDEEELKRRAEETRIVNQILEEAEAKAKTIMELYNK